MDDKMIEAVRKAAGPRWNAVRNALGIKDPVPVPPPEPEPEPESEPTS